MGNLSRRDTPRVARVIARLCRPRTENHITKGCTVCCRQEYSWGGTLPCNNCERYNWRSPTCWKWSTKTEMDYGNDPVSWFQKQIRGNMFVLSDHISKEKNELNYIRCQRIPKRPGADWHDIPEEKVPRCIKVRSKMLYASFKDRLKRDVNGFQVELKATDPIKMSINIIKVRALHPSSFFFPFFLY
ncbi:uncharacterized protein LOC131254823 [Magnolia sinica]|uniref:uncharacterized protein LOC131254823 n=1 Tax=Magnolia sinica TaxID=86752 RepID=UPI0026580A12|nr:uncharacterized protein LOC131254823 [Magnolia sinica]XP_058111522.1 uncharacterized protein LOC131254823 [Magnolia sinica]